VAWQVIKVGEDTIRVFAGLADVEIRITGKERGAARHTGRLAVEANTRQGGYRLYPDMGWRVLRGAPPQSPKVRPTPSKQLKARQALRLSACLSSSLVSLNVFEIADFQLTIPLYLEVRSLIVIHPVLDLPFGHVFLVGRRLYMINSFFFGFASAFTLDKLSLDSSPIDTPCESLPSGGTCMYPIT